MLPFTTLAHSDIKKHTGTRRLRLIDKCITTIGIQIQTATNNRSSIWEGDLTSLCGNESFPCMSAALKNRSYHRSDA